MDLKKDLDSKELLQLVTFRLGNEEFSLDILRVQEIIRHMDDNLCRCGTHIRIVAAIEEAAAETSGGAR